MAQLKTYYDDDGSSKQFYKEGFTRAIVNMSRKSNKPIYEVEAIIAKKVFKSESTVHGWRCDSSGGPGDINTVRELGQYLTGDTEAFLTTILEARVMTKLTERQLNAFKRVHDEIKQFIHDYYETDGFYSFVREEQAKVKDTIKETAEEDEIIYAYEMAEGMGQNKGMDRWGHVLFVLEQECFDLHDTAVYDELWQLIQEMSETWVSMRPVHEEVECEEGMPIDIINDERMNRYEKELKRIVETYN